MGTIKKIYQDQLVGVSEGSSPADEVYPITSTLAVYDTDGNNLQNILEERYEGVVRVIEQTFTPEEQEQARDNISAVGKAVIVNAVNNSIGMYIDEGEDCTLLITLKKSGYKCSICVDISAYHNNIQILGATLISGSLFEGITSIFKAYNSSWIGFYNLPSNTSAEILTLTGISPSDYGEFDPGDEPTETPITTGPLFVSGTYNSNNNSFSPNTGQPNLATAINAFKQGKIVQLIFTEYGQEQHKNITGLVNDPEGEGVFLYALDFDMSSENPLFPIYWNS